MVLASRQTCFCFTVGLIPRFALLHPPTQLVARLVCVSAIVMERATECFHSRGGGSEDRLWNDDFREYMAFENTALIATDSLNSNWTVVQLDVRL